MCSTDSAVEVEVNHHLDRAEVHLGIYAINEETITTKAEVEGSLSNTLGVSPANLLNQPRC